MRPIDADRLKYRISQELEDIGKSSDDVVAFAITKVIVKCFLEIIDETPTLIREKQYCNHDCDALYEAYAKGKESALKEMGKMNRYYSILRPVSLGTFPGRIHIATIHNFEHRTKVPGINLSAWGYFETPDKLTEYECNEYDLVEGTKHENMG